jgi:hypothetical protein
MHSLLTNQLACRWWIAALVLHRYDLGWLVPFLVWLGITVRLGTLYVSIQILTRPLVAVWVHVTKPFVDKVSKPATLGLFVLRTKAGVSEPATYPICPYHESMALPCLALI